MAAAQGLDQIFRSIGIDRNYDNMDLSGLALDLQGWGSNHPIFRHVLSTHKPQIIIEVGTWKGASATHMVKTAESLGFVTEVICIDTWLGSNDTLWVNPEFRKSLMLQHGYPNMFTQFIYNIRDAGVAKRLYPLPMTSSAAYHLLKGKSVTADVIYIDAGHEEEEVLIDLKLYYDLLKCGGAIFGDDYSDPWPGVIRAVNRFCADKGLRLVTTDDKYYFVKPRGG